MTKALEKTNGPLTPAPAFSPAQIDLLTRTICKGANPDELQLFLGICRRTGLDPFARQIYAIKRWDSESKREIMQPQASIDGLRLIAVRTGDFEGSVGPFWCGKDANWLDVWIEDNPPAAAKVGVWRRGFREPVWGIARYREYCQTDRSGSAVRMWRNMPANQLAKCAEALALRKAFPQELSGVYGADELDHAEREEDKPPKPQQAVESRNKPWTTFKGMVEEFGRLRGRLPAGNEPVYYEVLRKYGAEHSNDFRDSALAISAYNELLGIVEDLEFDKREPVAEEEL